MPNQTAIRFGYPDTLIKEYEHWIVLLREPQVTLGSLILCEKSEATEYSALSPEAYAEMGTAIGDIERVLHATFKYEKINYLMLMMVDPNVHFHVIPRYSKTRNACGLSIADHGWPAAPQLGETRDLTPAERDILRAHIVDFW